MQKLHTSHDEILADEELAVGNERKCCFFCCLFVWQLLSHRQFPQTIFLINVRYSIAFDAPFASRTLILISCGNEINICTARTKHKHGTKFCSVSMVCLRYEKFSFVYGLQRINVWFGRFSWWWHQSTPSHKKTNVNITLPTKHIDTWGGVTHDKNNYEVVKNPYMAMFTHDSSKNQKYANTFWLKNELRFTYSLGNMRSHRFKRYQQRSILGMNDSLYIWHTTNVEMATILAVDDD